MDHSTKTGDYWYFNRSELEAGQVFRLVDGSIVKLVGRVEGDGTKWEVADWIGRFASWSYEGSEIEPGDLQGDPITDTPEAIEKVAA